MPALCGLVQFAAQNSGLEWADYGGDGWAYRQKARSINQDWQRFKSALAVAAVEGVSDAEIVAAAPRSFSGRLSWGEKQHTPASVAANPHAPDSPSEAFRVPLALPPPSTQPHPVKVAHNPNQTPQKLDGTHRYR